MCFVIVRNLYYIRKEADVRSDIIEKKVYWSEIEMQGKALF